MKKRIASFLASAAISVLAFGFTTAAEVFEDDDLMHYNTLVKVMNREEITWDDREWLSGDGDVIAAIPSVADVELVKSGSAIFSFGSETPDGYIGDSNADEHNHELYAVFILYETPYVYHTAKINILEHWVIDCAEVFAAAGIDNGESITAVQIYEYVPRSCCSKTIIESAVLDGCKQGWQKYKHDRYCPGSRDIDRFYVKSDGTLATKSMTIDGVRYKFAKSGVCEGKYTGWTKSSKGRRYWKNGELLKNKTLRTKSGKVYRLDRNGYAAVKVS